MTIETLNILSGWIGICLGVFTGALFGLLFHKDDWLGGYNSWPRRMLRLGHISFFGLAFLNFMFALTAKEEVLQGQLAMMASLLFLAAAITMPIACFLSAWKKPLRYLFPVPVAFTCGALACTLFAIR